MAVPKRRTSKSKRNKRRSHDAISAPTLANCPECGAAMQPHRSCPSCGRYRKRRVTGVEED
jgi:large subunit ribosomal protein L32